MIGYLTWAAKALMLNSSISDYAVCIDSSNLLYKVKYSTLPNNSTVVPVQRGSLPNSISYLPSNFQCKTGLPSKYWYCHCVRSLPHGHGGLYGRPSTVHLARGLFRVVDLRRSHPRPFDVRYFRLATGRHRLSVVLLLYRPHAVLPSDDMRLSRRPHAV